ncbi:hypothetical protein Pcinc_010243 [Petrolisthes cinctipes]|uniref:Uncharacterized protein n=1 Tax=Petrolisthes cinctipes TaxID=88211 RepID=A0AAE1KVK3_PETCI|nr:hypothetical protein Pcinc_010243 [Petrolisthes cinctipes]
MSGPEEEFAGNNGEAKEGATWRPQSQEVAGICATWVSRGPYTKLQIPEQTGIVVPYVGLSRTVRGHLTILRELWDKDDSDQLDVMSTYEYIFKLREKLEDTCRIAQQNLKQSRVRYKTAYDRKARDRQFKVKDKVLLLLPTSHNKLLLQWQGLYEVAEKRNRMDYVIDQDGKRRI